MEKIKLFSMFSGYGGAEFALKKVGIPFEVVGFSEIDKYSIQCYNQNHGDIKNFGDCTKINPNNIPDFDLLTGGFPCQSFSVAGKGLGELDIRGTLFNDIIRIAEVKQPKYMLLENVKGLMSKKHKETFNKILSELKRIGYSVSYFVFNSRDYGTPQNRERVFFICFKEELDYCNWETPKKEKLNVVIKDILEKEVDNKYYLSEKALKSLFNKSHTFNLRRLIKKDYSPTLLFRDYKDPKLIQINNPKHSNNRVYSENGISPTLNTMQGGNRQPFIIQKIGDRDKTNFGMKKDYSYCIPSNPMSDRGQLLVNNNHIRKLTPTECFRLMGFFNDEINLEGLSDTQKYKLAGNGWDINLVSKIFNKLLNGTN